MPTVFSFRERIIAFARHPQSVARQGERKPRPAGLARTGKNLAVKRLIGEAGLPPRLAGLGDFGDILGG